MRTKLIFLSLAITLLSSCYHTKIKEKYDCGNKYGKEVIYTNTSSSKYLEVTIKVESSTHEWTETISLKPGEIKSEGMDSTYKISIVGEREI